MAIAQLLRGSKGNCTNPTRACPDLSSLFRFQILQQRLGLSLPGQLRSKSVRQFQRCDIRPVSRRLPPVVDSRGSKRETARIRSLHLLASAVGWGCVLTLVRKNCQERNIYRGIAGAGQPASQSLSAPRVEWSRAVCCFRHREWAREKWVRFFFPIAKPCWGRRVCFVPST